MILMLNKITNRFNIRLSVAIIFSTTSLPILYAQKNSEPQARAVGRVQQELNEKDLSLKIWDAYRPYSVTEKMWELIKDERYVADPKKGSGHNRGIAVDLTIIDRTTGKELDMGTGFDNFTDTAHQTFKNLPLEILNNRGLLKTVMEKNGFVAMETEWWHFFWNNQDFELLDIDPKKFKKI